MTSRYPDPQQGKPLPARKKIYELNSNELDNYQINEHCKFRDSKWVFTDHTAGRETRPSIDWGMRLTDGSQLTAPQHAVRLSWAKILVLTVLVAPAKRQAPKPGSMNSFQTAFNYLISWMNICGYDNPCELTPDAVRRYVVHVALFLSTRDGEIGESACVTALSILKRLWDQRYAMSNMGNKAVLVMSSHPFDGETINSIAQGMGTKALGWVKPIPNEVAVPLLNKAAWFLGTPADDVLRLLHTVRDPLAGAMTICQELRWGKPCTVFRKRGISSDAKYRRTREYLGSFRFGTPADGSGPWHANLDITRPKIGHSLAVVRMRELWDSVRDAALIVVQATSGMRSSELLGIKAGVDEHSGLPAGVRLEQSISGLYEWFVIRSELFKTEQGLPRAVDWVLGMRPVGSVEIPLAVRALNILNRISEPWRQRAKTAYLVLAPSVGRTLPASDAAQGPMSNQQLNRNMKRFITRWVDLSQLPDESAHKSEDMDLVRWRESLGTIFTTHMLRKSWAQFALACDSRLLPVIQMQFHHLSLAITEGYYIGRNPLLLETLDSVSAQKRNLLIFESVIGKKPLAGRMGEQLERALDQLRVEIGDLPTSKKWQKCVEWADRNDLTMFFTAHATCSPTQTSQMRCHDASNTPVWIRRAPNTSTREPSMCAGCACAIMDASHEPFWAERYVVSKVSLELAEAAGANMNAYREIRFRVDQARGILKKFGADLSALDAKAKSKLEAAYA